METHANTAPRLRELLLQLYASGVLTGLPELPTDEETRLLDIVLAAAEGRPFRDLGLPFPRREPLTDA